MRTTHRNSIMSSSSRFDSEREERVKRSKVREIFTPHQPINALDLFSGRQEQVRRLIELLNTPGQHALLYGDRGVGKTSLANATLLLMKPASGGSAFTKRCDSSTRFEDVLMEPLGHFGIDLTVSSRNEERAEHGQVGVSVGIGKVGVNSQRRVSEVFASKYNRLSPSLAAEVLATRQGVLMIDELDAIPDFECKRKLAELIKLLSDNGSRFKIMCVGIADTADELTAGHPSVQRCLREVKLGKMEDAELAGIITRGAQKLRMTFGGDVVSEIVRMSAGYAHFTHLLALKCAEHAVGSRRSVVDVTDLKVATVEAVDEAEASLRRVYDNAVRSHGTNMYTVILRAAAALNRTEFTTAQLRKEVAQNREDSNGDENLRNYLNKLVSKDRTTILRRVAKGVYAFNDPRMPAFIRIRHAEDRQSLKRRIIGLFG